MIKLPEYQPRGQTAALPTPNVSARISPDQIDGGMGKALGQIGQQFMDIAIKERNDALGTMAMDRQSELRTFEAGLTYGDNGFLNRKGKDALTVPQDTLKLWNDKVSELSKDMPPEALKVFTANIERQRQTLEGRLYQHSAQEMNNYYESTARATLDTLRNSAALAYGDAATVEEHLQSGLRVLRYKSIRDGESPEVFAAKSQAWTSNIHRDVVSRMLDENPMQAQQYLEQNRDKFTANDLLAVTHGVQAGVERVQERQRILADKRERDAESAVSQLESNSELGIPTSPTMLAAVQNAVKGTSAEPKLAALLDRQKAMLEFSRLPPDQMKQQIEGLRGQLMNSGAADPSKAASLLRNMENLHGNLVTSLKNDPLKIYQDRSGQQLEPITPQQLMSGAAAQSLRARESALGAIKKKYGDGVADSVLRPEEADAMRKAFETGTPDQQLSVFKGLFPLSWQVYRAAIKQISGSDEVALAGLFHAKGYTTENKEPVSRVALSGLRRLADKSFQLPPPDSNGEDSMLKKFNDTVGDAMPLGSQARDASYKMTRAIYAELAARAGLTSVTLDPNLMSKAVHLATGGIIQYQKQNVIPPYGMSEDDFTDKAKAAIRQAAPATDMPESLLMSLPLMAVAPGKYAIKIGRNTVMDRNGNQVLLEVK